MNNETYPYQTELDTQIKDYLKLYQDSFEIDGISSWYKYIYLMIDELLRKGLTSSDKMYIKQKYAEFRCYIETESNQRHLEFTKIISTYTHLIDSICQKCNDYGELETMDGWDVRLCAKHNPEHQNREHDDEENPKPPITESQYRFAADSQFNTLNDQLILIKISLLKRSLEEQQIEESVIQQILYDAIEPIERFELDETFYSVTSQFTNDNGDKVPIEDNFYSNQDYLREVIRTMYSKK